MSKRVNNEQISHITISGYKSIKGPITIEFKKLNVLIGSNGSGKSNFISIFKLLQNVLSQNLALFASLNASKVILKFMPCRSSALQAEKEANIQGRSQRLQQN